MKGFQLYCKVMRNVGMEIFWREPVYKNGLRLRFPCEKQKMGGFVRELGHLTFLHI